MLEKKSFKCAEDLVNFVNDNHIKKTDIQTVFVSQDEPYHMPIVLLYWDNDCLDKDIL